MKKVLLYACMGFSLTTSLTACVGSNAVTGELMKFNVKAVDNRYARGGLNFLLSPVYGLTIASDYIIFNSIEFWAGKNPINGKGHIFDTKTDTMIEVNDKLDPSLQDAPLSYNRTLERAIFNPVDDSIFNINMEYSDGSMAVLKGIKDGDNISYFINGEQVGTSTIQQLTQYARNGTSTHLALK